MPAKKNQRTWGHIRKLDSGRFQASFVGPDLKRYNGPGTFDLKSTAEGWLAVERAGIQESWRTGKPWISPDQRNLALAVKGETVNEYGKRWIENRPNLKPSTRIGYREKFDQHIEPTLGKIGIGNLTSDDINRWYGKLLVDKPTARSRTYSLLHAICEEAVCDL